MCLSVFTLRKRKQSCFLYDLESKVWLKKYLFEITLVLRQGVTPNFPQLICAIRSYRQLYDAETSVRVVKFYIEALSVTACNIF